MPPFTIASRKKALTNKLNSPVYRSLQQAHQLLTSTFNKIKQLQKEDHAEIVDMEAKRKISSALSRLSEACKYYENRDEKLKSQQPNNNTNTTYRAKHRGNRKRKIT